jgi:four helix bundle protein
LPTKNNKIAQVIGDQVLRSGTSIGAQLCEAQAASSRRDFIYKVQLAEKEARETQYWLWLVLGSEIFPESKLSDLYDESSQIVAIITTIGKNTRSKGIKGKAVSLLCLLLGL